MGLNARLCLLGSIVFLALVLLTRSARGQTCTRTTTAQRLTNVQALLSTSTLGYVTHTRPSALNGTAGWLMTQDQSPSYSSSGASFSFAPALPTAAAVYDPLLPQALSYQRKPHVMPVLTPGFETLYSVVSADLNGDALEDVVSCTSAAVLAVRNLGWTRGYARALATSSVGSSSAASARKYMLADMDADGALDLVFSDTSTIRWFRNVALDGSFAPGSTLIVTAPAPTFIRASNCERIDSDVDVDCVYVLSSGVLILASDTSGTGTTFSVASIDATLTTVTSCTMTLGDLSGDGNKDIVLGTGQSVTPSRAVYVYLATSGSGTFAARAQVSTNNDVRGVVLADTDADGDLDIFIISSNFGPRRVLNAGGGTFSTEATLIGIGFYARALAFADLSGDAFPDAVVVVSNYITVNVNTGTGLAFALNQTVGFAFPLVDSQALTTVAIVDVDGDGLWDIVAADGSAMVAFRRMPGLGPRLFDSIGDQLISPGIGSGLGSSLDGVLTVGPVTAAPTSQFIVGIASNTSVVSTLSWAPSGRLMFDNPVVLSNMSMAYQQQPALVFDYDLDGDLDVMFAATSTAGVLTRRNMHVELAAAPGAQLVFTAGPTLRSAFNEDLRAWHPMARDLDGDGDTDVLWPAPNANAVLLFANLGGGLFNVTRLQSSCVSARGAAVADLDGDGDLDYGWICSAYPVLAMRTGPSPTSVSLVTLSSTLFTSPYTTSYFGGGLTFAQLNPWEDSLMDLAMSYFPSTSCCSAVGAAIILRRPGPVSAANWALPAAVSLESSNVDIGNIVVGLYNDDNVPDLLYTRWSQTSPFLRLGTQPPWTLESSLFVSGLSSFSPAAVVTDLNLDGMSDALWVGYGGSVAGRINSDGQWRSVFAPWPTSAYSDSAYIPVPMLVIDLNADGRNDVLVASATSPFQLFFVPVLSPPVTMDGFGALVVLSTGVQILSLAVRDANLDGMQDILMLRRVSVGQTEIAWMRGLSRYAASFDAPVALVSVNAALGGPVSTTASLDATIDHTGDLLGDFAVCNRYTAAPAARIALFSSGLDSASGNISLVATGTISAPDGQTFTFFDFAQLDGDGVWDLLATVNDTRSGGGLLYAFGLGGGTFSFGTFVGVPTRGGVTGAPGDALVGMRTVAVGDFDNDGRVDLVAASLVTGTPVQFYRSMGAEGAGDGGSRYMRIGNYTLGASGFTGFDFSIHASLAVADYNGDGLLDVLASPGSISGGGARFHFADNSGAMLPWAQSGAPRREVLVNVRRCGYTMACVKDAVAATLGACEGTALAGQWSVRKVVLPPGNYTGCNQVTGWVVPRSVWLAGSGASVTRIVCEPPLDSGNTDGRYVFAVGAGVQLTLSDLTITGAYTGPTTFGGAAISVSGAGALVRLVDVLIVSCSASLAGQISVRSPEIGFGAAVLVTDGGALIANRTRFDQLFAGYGGSAIAALGVNVTVMVDSCEFTSSLALVAGGAIFAELSTAGTLNMTIVDSRFVGSQVTGDPADPTITPQGGAIAALGYAGTLALTLRRTSVLNSASKANGGGLFVKSAYTARVLLTLTECTFEGNSAVITGGAVLADASDVSSLAVSLVGGRYASNVAGTRGGGMALRATSTGLTPATTTPTIRATVSGAPAFVANSAVLGGGLIVDASGGTAAGLVPIIVNFVGGTGAANFTGNYASYVGGGLATLGRVVVDSSLGGLAFRANDALAGGAVGAMGAADYRLLSGARPAGSGALPSTSDTVPCAQMGTIRLVAPVLLDNQASYGSAAFLCESQLSLGSLGAGDLTVPGPGRGLVGGGVLFVCSNRVDTTNPAAACQAGSGTSVPGAGPSASALNAPWFTADAASDAALDALNAVLVESTSYGAVAASPVISLTWLNGRLPPSVMSSGAPFPAGEVVVVARDSFGQPVIDTNVVLLFRVDPATPALRAEVVGSTPKLLLGTSEIDFVGVGVALYAGSPLQVPTGVQVVIDRAATPTSSPYFAVASSSIALDACLPGNGVLPSTAGLLECALCQEGTFANDTSLLPCRVCPASDQLTGVGATGCFLCPANTVPLKLDPGAAPNCTCKGGFYNPSRVPNQACDPCPDGGTCDGGDAMPYCAPGFYPTADPLVFIECPNRGACLGGLTAQCATGYAGRLCGRCVAGYYALGLQCRRCDNRTIPVLFAVGVLITLAVLGLVLFNSRDDVSYRLAAIMIGLNSLQITATYGQLTLVWPEFARAFFNVLSIVSFRFDLSSPECATIVSDVWLLKFWLTAALPLLMLVPFGIVVALLVLYVRVVLPRGKLTFFSWLTQPRIVESSRRTYIQVLSIMYLPLTAMCFAYFQCQRARDGSYVFSASPARKCYDAKWWQFFAGALIFGLVYALGIPALVWFVLTRSRRRALANSDAGSSALELWELRMSFLVGRFKREYYRFEVQVLIRKASVVFAMTVFQAAQTRANLAITFLMLSLLQLVRFMPYRAWHHSVLDATCLASCTGILWAGTFSKSDLQRNGIAIALAVNLAAILVGNIYDAVWLYRTRSRAEREFVSAATSVGKLSDEVLYPDDLVRSTRMDRSMVASSSGNEGIALASMSGYMLDAPSVTESFACDLVAPYGLNGSSSTTMLHPMPLSTFPSSSLPTSALPPPPLPPALPPALPPPPPPIPASS